MTVPGNLSSPLLAVAAAGAAAVNITKSVRFNSADSAHLNRTPSSAGSNTTWTLSTWVKKTGNDNHIFGAGAGNTPGRFGFGFNGSDKIFALVVASGSTVFQITTDAVFRDPAGWYHLVLIADTGNSTQADRFKIYVNGVLQSVSGTLMPSSQNTFVNTTAAHVIGRRSYNTSDPFNGYLADFYLIDGTALEPTSFGAFDDNGVWQAAAYSGSFGTNGFHLFDFASESTVGHDSSGNENDFTVNNISQASLITWSNGWSNNLLAGFPATNCFNGTGTGLTIGGSNVKSTWTAPSSIPFTTLSIRGAHDGANINVNGTDVTSQFSSGLSVVTVTGISSPLTSIDLDNTNGQGNARISAIRIDGELLADDAPYPSAGNDVLFDVPTNGDSSDDSGAGGEVSGNYCTWNPLDSQLNFASLANGNLEHTGSSSGSYFSFSAGTIGFDSSTSTGFYFEVTQLTYGDSSSIGLHDTAYPVAGLDYGSWIGSSGNPNGISYVTSGTVYNFGSTISSQGTYTSNGDVIGVAVKDNKIWFSKNGTYISGNPSTGTSPTATLSSAKVLTPIINGFTSGVYALNAGQRAFNTAAPTGYKALCTTNLPTPTIADGSDYFDTTLYTGNGSTQTISGLEFSPDFVWIKSRGGLAGGSHQLYDQVRGATKRLRTNGTDAEVTQSTGLTAFTSDGFTVGNNSSSNYNNDPYVVWAWDAGTSNASNTDGSITSSVRANIASGFSIVTWTGTSAAATIGHGLGASLGMYIIKNRDDSTNWAFYHKSVGATKKLLLNTTDGASTSSFFNSTEPTSSVFSVGGSGTVNNSGNEMIALCWAPVEGYSAFGSYTGNGSTDGPFISTNFRPAWLLIKRSNGTAKWYLVDSTRDPDNTVNLYLQPSSSSEEIDTSSEGTKNYIDFLSNGFKLRGTEISTNASQEYVYIAFAENPFQANGGLAR
jgi:hypothetical protein